jgi:hypothetical protein
MRRRISSRAAAADRGFDATASLGHLSKVAAFHDSIKRFHDVAPGAASATVQRVIAPDAAGARGSCRHAGRVPRFLRSAISRRATSQHAASQGAGSGGPWGAYGAGGFRSALDASV